MSSNIDNIIEKYWQGTTSVQEESLLRDHLAKEPFSEGHASLKAYLDFSGSSQNVKIPKAVDASSIIAIAENIAMPSKSDIDNLLESYWTGDSSIEDYDTLEAYFTAGQVAEQHQYIIPLFSYFQESRRIQVLDEVRVDDIISDGEAASDEEPAPLPQISNSRVRRMMPRLAAIAASFVVLLVATFYMMENTKTTKTYADAAEADEALEITMEALAFLGHNYEKGSKPMAHIKQLEKTNIFKLK